MLVCQIQSKNGVTFLVSEQDAEKVIALPWYARKNRSGVWRVTGFYREHKVTRTITLSRFLLDAPSGLLVDHKDGNGLNNTRDNLRLATKAQNNRNRRICTASSNSFKGIVRVRSGRWEARISVNSVRISLGRFSSDVEAAKAYDSAALHYYGEFARLNFPDETPAVYGQKIKREKYRGAFQRKSGRWTSKLKFNNTHVYIGTFDTPEQAAEAYNKKVIELGAPSKWLNNLLEANR